MVILERSPLLGRLIRQDHPVEELGISTYGRIQGALRSGTPQLACSLLRYMLDEFVVIYRFMIDWISDLGEFHAEHGQPGALERAYLAAKEKVLGPRQGFVRRSPPMLRDLWDWHLDNLRRGEEDPGSLGRGLEADFERSATDNAREADSLVEGAWLEYLIPHDFVVAWAHELLTEVALACGEGAVPDAISRTYEQRWKARYETWSRMTPLERVQLSVEGMRGHLSGRSRRGDLNVFEEDDRYVIQMDPCGSGGMLRVGDFVTGAGPYETDGRNKEPHEWTWNRTGVPWYSTHCPIVMEMFTKRDWGHPMRPVQFPEEREGPCRWFIYKKPAPTH